MVFQRCEYPMTQDIVKKIHTVNLKGLLASSYCYCTSLLFALVFPLCTGFDIFYYFCKGHKRHQNCKYLYMFGLRKTNSRFKKMKSHQYSSYLFLPRSILGNLNVNFFQHTGEKNENTGQLIKLDHRKKGKRCKQKSQVTMMTF